MTLLSSHLVCSLVRQRIAFGTPLSLPVVRGGSLLHTSPYLSTAEKGRADVAAHMQYLAIFL